MTSLNEFAKSLTDKYGLSDNDALNFLKEMFAVITDELRNGSDATSVKVKGLGTFRMQSVNPRVSVDVNTGERILIDGRYKIVFTPEAMLRDRVNSPFAQFETFVVNEGIDFSQVDEEENEGITSLEETSSDDVPSDEILSEDIPSEPPVTLEEPSSSEEPVSSEGLSSSGEPVSSGEPSSSDEPISSEEPSLSEESSSEDIPEGKENSNDNAQLGSAQTAAHAASDVAVALMRKPTKESEDKVDEADNYVQGNECHRQRVKMWRYVLTFSVVVLVAIAGIVFYFNKFANDNIRRIEQLESKARVNVSPAPKVKSKPAAAVKAVSQKVDTMAVVPSVPKSKVVTEQEPSSVKEISIVKDAGAQAAHKSTLSYDSDSRIRTGAYMIVGVSKRVKLQKGQTLKSLSKFYLGEGMECYVEAVNNYRELKAGDMVNIPALKLKPRKR